MPVVITPMIHLPLNLPVRASARSQDMGAGSFMGLPPLSLLASGAWNQGFQGLAGYSFRTFVPHPLPLSTSCPLRAPQICSNPSADMGMPPPVFTARC